MSRPLGFLCAALFLALGIHSLAQAAPPIFLLGLWSTILTLGVLVPAAAAGRAALEFLALRGAAPAEMTLLGAALGLGCASYGVFGLGLAARLSTGWALALLGLMAVLGRGQYRQAWDSLRGEVSVFPASAGAACLVLLGLAYLMAWIPPHQYDSLVYHLALPETYVRTGRLAAAPHLLYSHFPQNAEMLFTLGLLLGSDVTAQLLSVAATGLTALWVFSWARREWPASSAAAGCALFLSHTAVLLLASTTYVEPFLTLWITSSLVCFYKWWDAPLELRGAQKWLVLSGISCGIAFGTKYYAGLVPAILALLLAFRLFREPRLAAASLLAFAAAALVPALPWLIKNTLAVGNPVFPFLYSWFPHRGVAWTAEGAQRYFAVLTEYGHAGFWADLVKFPYVLFTRATRFGGGMDVLGDFGWTLPFAAVPLFLSSARKSPLARFLLAYLGCHFVGWFATGVVLRFLTVTAPLFALLAAHALCELWAEAQGAGKALLAAGIAAFLAGRLILFGYVHAVFQGPGVLLGLESQQAFLERRLAYYPCARHATGALAKNDRILMVGEQRAYYLHAEHLATSVYQKNLFEAELEAASDAADLARRLREAGVTHILQVPAEAERLRGYGLFRFGGKQALWDGFLKGLKTEFTAPGCSVSRIGL